MENKKSRKIAKKKIKEKLVNELGGCCKECQESDIIVLQFDHIKDDGYKDKKNGVRQGRTIYHYYGIYNADRRLFFSTFQILCANCNVRKEHKRRSSCL